MTLFAFPTILGYPCKIGNHKTPHEEKEETFELSRQISIEYKYYGCQNTLLVNDNGTHATRNGDIPTGNIKV